ncbi:ADAMTS10 [Symbiodinium sp. CCMP2456]|nr:ADAMTS10 [Symbiodinium sp. CCMP2456]
MSVITTTGAIVGDTPDLLKPLSTSFEEIRSTITKELVADPAPDVSCEQIASTTEWLRSIIAAMTEHNSGFSRLGVSQLGDEELQRNQALAREASRQLTVLLAENTKQFRAVPMGAMMAFGEGSQSQEVRQNLATFRQFWEKFGDAKWLSGLVAPEFAEKKELAKKLLDTLQATTTAMLPNVGAVCKFCKCHRGNSTYCQNPDCGRCPCGSLQCNYPCGGVSPYKCNYCNSLRRREEFCSNTNCARCAHGHFRSRGCLKGCSEVGSTNIKLQPKSVSLYDKITACSEETSKSKLLHLAQMADLLAKACRKDAEAMEAAEKKLQQKMDLLKDFAEAVNDVPKVLRQFLLIRSGSIKDDLGQLKEWLHKDEVDSAHMQLEEFRDEAAEERVMRRVGQKRALSEGSWSLASPR